MKNVIFYDFTEPTSSDLSDQIDNILAELRDVNTRLDAVVALALESIKTR